MKHTSMSMKNSSQWKIDRPTDADASGSANAPDDDCDAPRYTKRRMRARMAR